MWKTSLHYQKIIQYICALSIILLGLQSCTTVSKKTDSVLEPELSDKPLDHELKDDQVVILPQENNKKYISSPVVLRLLNKSREKLAAKQYAEASSLIERGINISPNDPLLWQRLAVIRLEEGNYQQAKQLATKSNILLEGDEDLRTINEDIIQRANAILRVH